MLELPEFAKITNAGMLSVAKIRSLQALRLAKLDSVADEGVDFLGALSNLERLQLSNLAEISNRIASVDRLKSLRSCEIIGCRAVTLEGILDFSRKRPMVRMTLGLQ